MLTEFRAAIITHSTNVALGAPEVVLSHSARDEAGPTIPSRFLLRIKALIGTALQADDEVLAWADALDHPAEKEAFATRPLPWPSAKPLPGP